jgi:hypothetical protein
VPSGDDRYAGTVSTSDIIAIVAAGFAALSALLAGWAAYTAHQARKWQRERDAERRRTRLRAELTTTTMHAGRRRTRGRVDLMPIRMHARRIRARAELMPIRMDVGGADVLGLNVNVINDGDRPEYVTGVTVRSATPGRFRHIEIVDLGPRSSKEGSWPRELRPHANLRFVRVLRDMDLRWAERGMVARVDLSSGATIVSGVQRLPERPPAPPDPRA